MNRATPDPDAVFVYGILLPDSTVPATLAEHRLTWSGPATVVDAPGRVVYGGLVFVDERRLRAYDRIEGINERIPELGYYRREVVQVQSLGATVDAWVYKMNRIGVYGEHRPDPSYVAFLADEYMRLNHPAVELAVRA